MKDIAHNIGFEIVYGDTDSLFLNYVDNSNAVEVISKFKEECNKQLSIEVEHAKTYQTAIISESKKHYIGWTGIEGREPDIVGMYTAHGHNMTALCDHILTKLSDYEKQSPVVSYFN